MKKNLVTLLVLLFMTGCSNIDYNLKYSEGKFNEKISIEALKADESVFSLKELKESFPNEEITYLNKGSKEEINYEKTYDLSNLKKALSFNEVFSKVVVEEEKNSIFIHLMPPLKAEYIGKFPFVFESDTKVLRTNGKKMTNNKVVFYDLSEGVVLHFEKYESKKTSFKLIIYLVSSSIFLILLIRLKKVKEKNNII